MSTKSDIGVGVVRPKNGQSSQTTFIKEKQESGDLRAPELSEKEIAQARRDGTKSSLDFETLPEKLAHSKLCYKHYPIAALETAFPVDTLSWSVDYCFPMAQGGALHIDEPAYPYNVEICRQKAKVMKTAGLRYVFLEKGATFETALQLLKGEIK